MWGPSFAKAPFFFGERVLSDLLAKQLCSVALSVLAVVFIGGCAANPDGGNTAAGDNGRMPLADSQAAFGYEEADWDQAFWEKWLDKARQAGRDEAGGNTATASNASSDTAAAAGPALNVSRDPSGLSPKIGVYIDAGSRDSLTAYRLINALDRHAAAYGITLVKPAELDEAVAGSDACASETPLDCPRLLAIYPGIRALLVIDAEKLGASTRQIATRMMDTDFDIRYEPVSTEIALRAKNTGPGSDVAAWSERVLGMAADRIGIAPWFTHSFALNGEDFYISAGREAGLEQDATLAVHGEGSLLRSPAGNIIAWEPGPEVGRVRIKQLVGQNVALAEQVSGRKPAPKDRLTLVK